MDGCNGRALRPGRLETFAAGAADSLKAGRRWPPAAARKTVMSFAEGGPALKSAARTAYGQPERCGPRAFGPPAVGDMGPAAVSPHHRARLPRLRTAGGAARHLLVQAPPAGPRVGRILINRSMLRCAAHPPLLGTGNSIRKPGTSRAAWRSGAPRRGARRAATPWGPLAARCSPITSPYKSSRAMHAPSLLSLWLQLPRVAALPIL